MNRMPDQRAPRPVTVAKSRALSRSLAVHAVCLAVFAAAAVTQKPAGAADGDAATAAPIAAAPDAKLDSARATLEKWVETRRLISQEKRDWVTGREVLVDRIELLQREIEALRGRVAETGKGLATNQATETELAAEKQTLAAAADGLRQALPALETATHQLLARLPERVRTLVAPISQRIPTESAESQAATSRARVAERFAPVIGVLNELNKAQREIVVTKEVHALPDGTRAEVDVLYLGIGSAFYVNAKGDAAGVGTAAPDGWVWTPAPEHAAAIAAAIAVHQGATAVFVPLPIRIQMGSDR